MRNNEKYINKWESMLYRLLKMLFWIRTNINKQKLFEVLELRKPKWIIAEYLSIKTIKLKLDCFFFKENHLNLNVYAMKLSIATMS